MCLLIKVNGLTCRYTCIVSGAHVDICLQEELEAQVSLLQGQINDLEAMSKYCAKMMNVHIGELNRPRYPDG